VRAHRRKRQVDANQDFIAIRRQGSNEKTTNRHNFAATLGESRGVFRL